MKTRFLAVQGKKVEWADNAAAELTQKISAIIKFDRMILKTTSAERADAATKVAAEGKSILKSISDNETVVLFDESGREFKNSHEFSNALVKLLSQQSPLVFVIGGPYGHSEDVRKRATQSWSLSRLTMNHHIAQIAALEQLYRGLSIWKNLPYHN